MTTGLNVPDKGRWDAEAVPWTRICLGCGFWDIQKGCRRYKLPARCVSARIPPPGPERDALVERIAFKVSDCSRSDISWVLDALEEEA